MIVIQIIHVIVSITLILFILLQTGKGSDLGAMLGGGGANTIFGATGATSFLSKLTSYAAVVFVFTCLTLAYISAHPTTAMDGDGTVMEGQNTPAPKTDGENPEEGDWKEKAASNKEDKASATGTDTTPADSDDAPADSDDAPSPADAKTKAEVNNTGAGAEEGTETKAETKSDAASEKKESGTDTTKEKVE